MTDRKEIIDYVKKGNQVRFFLGKNGNQWGDDWDDIPYEHNAGTVYKEFIEGNEVVAFNFDALVVEPSYGVANSKFSKQDMVNRHVPCIAVIPKEFRKEYGYDSFEEVIADQNCIKIYFGDNIMEAVSRAKCMLMR